MSVTLPQGSQSVLSEPNARLDIMSSLRNFSALLGNIGDIAIQTKTDIETFKIIDDQVKEENVHVSVPKNENESVRELFVDSLNDTQKNLLTAGILGLIGMSVWLIFKKF